VLNQQLAAIEKTMAHAYRTDPLRYAQLFKLHHRLQQQAEDADADLSLTRAGPEHADTRQRSGRTRAAARTLRHRPTSQVFSY
jgi:hypothetical protein